MITLYVLTLLCVNDQILLVRRNNNQTFGGGFYSLVGGKVEPNERGLQAIQREVQEETGLTLQESDFSFVHAFHRNGTENPFIALCYKADITGMMPCNKEQDKHDDMRMFDINTLPDNILPAHKQALLYIMRNIAYSEHGW